MEFVPESLYRVLKHYSSMNQRMPLIFVKFYTYQIFRGLAYIHSVPGVCHRDVKPQNVLVDPLTHQVKLCGFGSAKILINTCNGFYCDSFKPNNETSHKMWTENWTGWFKSWDSPDPHRPAEDVAFAVARFFQRGGIVRNVMRGSIQNLL